MRTDEPSRVEALTGAATIQVAWSFSPMGCTWRITSSTHPRHSTSGLTHYGSAGKPLAGKPKPFLSTSSYETYPSISPDGRWMAYGLACTNLGRFM